MALNTESIIPYERSSQTAERRRSLFPQNCIDSGEDSDLGCISPLSSSSYEDDDSYTTQNVSNIRDYDIIGIVRKDFNITPISTPIKDHTLVIDETPVNSPQSNDSERHDAAISKKLFCQTSPTCNLKTPHDTVTMNSKLPRLTHKSVTDSCSSAPSKRKLSPYNSPELPSKSSKVDIKNSKVRTTLFPESDLFVPTKKFYSNSSQSIMDQLKEFKKQSSEPFINQLKDHRKTAGSFKNQRRRTTSRKKTGGVTHKIRKPRQKKNAPLPRSKSTMNETQSKALRYYLENLRELKSASGKKKLIDEKENASPEVSSVSLNVTNTTSESGNNLFANNQLVFNDYPKMNSANQNSNEVLQSSSSTLNISTNIGQNTAHFTQNSTGVPLFAPVATQTPLFPNGSNTFVTASSSNENKLNTRFISINPFPTTNFSTNQPWENPFSNRSVTINQSFGNQMPTSYTHDGELSKKRPLSPTIEESVQNKKFFKFSRGNKGIVTMNESMKLMVDHGKVSLMEGQMPKTQPHIPPDFETDDIALEEPVMSQVVMDNILSTLNDENVNDVNEKQTLQSYVSQNQQLSTTTLATTSTSSTPGCSSLPTTNAANLILSPISQMCDVTSGLAINSPKRGKNLSSVIENVSRSNGIALLLPPKGDVTGKKKGSTLAARKLKKLHKDQMLLDAGQSKFGLTQCPECNYVYHIGDPSDETCHMNYHEAVPVLKFGGWKNERVVADFQQKGRIIQIKSGDPRLWWKRVADLMEVVGRELGSFDMEFNLENSQVFLYIKSRTIVGCLVAVRVSEGYRMLTTRAHESDLCSERNFPVKCGVARLWVSHKFRKQGVATALMNILRKNFLFGYFLNNNEIAFSSPTEEGKTFAKKYFNTPNFMIYFP